MGADKKIGIKIAGSAAVMSSVLVQESATHPAIDVPMIPIPAITLHNMQNSTWYKGDITSITYMNETEAESQLYSLSY